MTFGTHPVVTHHFRAGRSDSGNTPFVFQSAAQLIPTCASSEIVLLAQNLIDHQRPNSSACSMLCYNGQPFRHLVKVANFPWCGVAPEKGVQDPLKPLTPLGKRRKKKKNGHGHIASTFLGSGTTKCAVGAFLMRRWSPNSSR